MDGRYVTTGQHAEYCEVCSSLNMDICVDFSESPQAIDNTSHAYKCYLCFEYFSVQEHSGVYTSDGPEEHYIVCDLCNLEYIREAHDLQWYPDGDDPTSTLHKGYCYWCDFEPEPGLHDDTNMDSLCDRCDGQLPFCMICGENGYGETYELREVDGQTVHAFLCSHDRHLFCS